jgi:hypothetical protein
MLMLEAAGAGERARMLNADGAAETARPAAADAVLPARGGVISASNDGLLIVRALRAGTDVGAQRTGVARAGGMSVPAARAQVSSERS